MTTRRALSLVLFAITPAACSDGGVDSIPIESAGHVLTRSCGPADERSVMLVMASEVDPQACGAHDLSPSVSITMYVSPATIEAPATYSFGFVGGGNGLVCPGDEEDCDFASAGYLKFDSFEEDEGGSGAWMLVTRQGTSTGTFDAFWCEREDGGPLC